LEVSSRDDGHLEENKDEYIDFAEKIWGWTVTDTNKIKIKWLIPNLKSGFRIQIIIIL